MRTKASWPMFVTLAILLWGAFGCGGAGDPGPVPPPSNLRYSTNPATYTQGVPIEANLASSDHDSGTSFSVTPPLPVGLSLDPSTGTITGTPTALSNAAIYTVTETGTAGSTSVTLTVAVVAPGFNYGANPAVYTKGVAITANQPGPDAAQATYSVSPALPAGLGLNTSTGVITGTPSAIHSTATYAVTKTTSAGSSTVGLSITVNDLPISAGASHSCALVSGGVDCWGWNRSGQLGDGSTAERHVPVAVTGLTAGVQAISAGNEHTCAIVNGVVRCWGSNDHGQLGNNSTVNSATSVQVAGLTTGVDAVSAGGIHTCAIVAGAAKCWGSNSLGRLGSTSPDDSPTPVQVAGLTSGVEAIAAGYYHTCAIVNGDAWCWGSNSDGQLGQGIIRTPTYESVPVKVSGLPAGARVKAIGVGSSHTCALVNDGVWCWGSNYSGELGNTSVASRSLVPVQVTGMATGVASIAAGASFTCAGSASGLFCWGMGYEGQLGSGSFTSSGVPVQVRGLTTAAQGVAAGVFHTCAWAAGGVACWGNNLAGQLGNNSTTNSNVPVQVPGLASNVQ